MQGDSRKTWRPLPTAVILAMSCGLAGLAVAQDEGGGMRLRFGITQELATRSNPGLRVPSADSEAVARTRFDFGFVTETRTERMALSLGGALEAGKDREHGLAQPRADLSYRRESAGTLLDLAAFYHETEVDALDFSAGEDVDGRPLLSTTDGTGTQRRRGGTMRLDFGRQSPFGGTLSLGTTKTDYYDTTDPGLVDNRRHNARLGLRYDLDAVTQLRGSASLSRLKEEGAATKKTEGVSFGIASERINGQFTADIGLSWTETGRRESFMLGRSYDFPTGQLWARLGVSGLAVGGSNLIGGLDWRQELPQGDLLLSASQEISGDARDEENRISRLSVMHSRELTPLSTGRIGLTMQDSKDTTTGLSTRTADLSMGLHYDLTPDWGLDLGATYRRRDEDGIGRAHSTNLHLSLSRNFEFLY